ncbi:CDP-diacylglycerol--glycerol-3-phosphate 3-phosphatidyltransferase [Austwickia chelonae]|uniref:CDP-diacylglycerol--glycerol-3-phosphate 3-phosphatidyltransferase n=1 Tax=Austwickia chelonae TaxID=100225 RepID=UPI000E229226
MNPQASNTSPTGEPSASQSSVASGPQNVPPSPWNLPNALTVLRILMVPLYGWLLLSEGGTDTTLRWWACAVFVLAMITDRLDGEIARAKGLITDFGKMADPIADKALTGMGFIGLSLIGDLWWWVTGLILARELGVTLLRFVVIRYGVMAASKGGKLKTFLQAVALGMLTAPGGDWWLWLAYAVTAAATVVTVGTGVDYVLKARALVVGQSRDRKVGRQE